LRRPLDAPPPPPPPRPPRILAAGPWLLIGRAYKDAAKAGLALGGAKFAGFPNAPHYVSSHAELFLFVAAALLSVVVLANTLARAVRLAPPFALFGVDNFASWRRQLLTQVALSYLIVYVKPNSEGYKYAMPVGGLMAHALLFDRERKLCTGGVLLVAMACAWLRPPAPLPPPPRARAAHLIPPPTHSHAPFQGSPTASLRASLRRKSLLAGTRAPRCGNDSGQKTHKKGNILPGPEPPLIQKVLVRLVLVLRGVAALAHHPRGVALHQLALPVEALLLPPLPVDVRPLLLDVRVLEALHKLGHVVVAARDRRGGEGGVIKEWEGRGAGRGGGGGGGLVRAPLPTTHFLSPMSRTHAASPTAVMATPKPITYTPPKPKRGGLRFLNPSAGKPMGFVKPPGGGMSWKCADARGGGVAILPNEKEGLDERASDGWEDARGSSREGRGAKGASELCRKQGLGEGEPKLSAQKPKKTCETRFCARRRPTRAHFLVSKRGHAF
jgi:hypothetical protein